MKKKISLALLSLSSILLISFLFFFKGSASPGLTCSLEFGSCSSGICVFSLNQATNSHSGDCNYGDWRVCCQDPGFILTSTVKTANCDPGLNEAGVISLHDTSNSHAWSYSDGDSLYHVCLSSSSPDPFACAIRVGSCDVGTCLASMNQLTSSHVGDCPEYNTKICCGDACEGTISVSNDDISCGESEFTITASNIGFSDLIVDINDTLWEDTNCDGTPDILIDYAEFLGVALSSGDSINIPWQTDQTADPNLCYNHTVYFCSKPLDASNKCWKGTSSCLDEAKAGNIVIISDFGFHCEPVPGECGNGIINLDEDCDMGPPERLAGCEPYEKCGLPGWSTGSGDHADQCQCYDFRPIECVGCVYYDYCDSGYVPGTSKSCCSNKITGLEAPCCILGGVPEKDCSKSGAVYNYLEVNASSDYCFNADCDITGKCIDSSWIEHETFETC